MSMKGGKEIHRGKKKKNQTNPYCSALTKEYLHSGPSHKHLKQIPLPLPRRHTLKLLKDHFEVRCHGCDRDGLKTGTKCRASVSASELRLLISYWQTLGAAAPGISRGRGPTLPCSCLPASRSSRSQAAAH